MIIEKKGNIFTTQSQTIVNAINCVGIMGAGIAYEFKLRNPQMFEAYRKLCDQKQIDIGKLWIYNDKSVARYQKILNFPTKYDWKYPSKEEYLHRGLEKFVSTYEAKNITSIAFPLLGADKGGLQPHRVMSIMKSYLCECHIDVELWHFSPNAKDDIYEDFKSLLLELDEEVIKKESKIRIDKIKLLKNALNNSNINSLSGLLRVKGVGASTIEKVFLYAQERKKQPILF